MSGVNNNASLVVGAPTLNDTSTHGPLDSATPQLGRFDIDTVSSYDPELIEATITKEKYADYVKRFLPHLESLRDTVLSEDFATNYADKSAAAAGFAINAGKGLVDARRGRMGLSAAQNNTSDELRNQALENTAFNSGLRKAKDLQNSLLVG